jgi:hypothetical protein
MLPEQFQLHVLTSIGPGHFFLAFLRRRIRLDKMNPEDCRWWRRKIEGGDRFALRLGRDFRVELLP